MKNTHSSGLYTDKPDNYFSHARTDIEPLLIQKNVPCRALEIGCSGGHTLAWLKEKGYCTWVAGVEPHTALHDNHRVVDHFEAIDIESQRPEIHDASLDLILCLDVLEHLRDPWRVMSDLSALLKPGGRWIVSLPNLRNYRIIKKLVFNGEFQYAEAGIMDKTHLRFFTRKSAIEMIENAGAHVEAIITPDISRLPKKIMASLGLRDFLAKQFLITAVKK